MFFGVESAAVKDLAGEQHQLVSDDELDGRDLFLGRQSEYEDCGAGPRDLVVDVVVDRRELRGEVLAQGRPVRVGSAAAGHPLGQTMGTGRLNHCHCFASGLGGDRSLLGDRRENNTGRSLLSTITLRAPARESSAYGLSSGTHLRRLVDQPS
jgi:hypothetical protein